MPEESEFEASFAVLGAEGEAHDVHDLYGAFRRPGTEADRVAGETAHDFLDVGPELEDLPSELPDHVREELALGDVIQAEGRLLLSGLGGEEDTLYAAPTNGNNVAFTLLPSGSGGCTAPGPDGLILAGTSSEASLVVYGLVGDAVAAVDVVVNGEPCRARMGENAFGLRIDDATPEELDAILLHRANGTINELDLGGGSQSHQA